MTTESIDKYLLKKAGTQKDYKEEWGWHRYKVGEKMFAAICKPGSEHNEMYAEHTLLTLKTNPDNTDWLCGEYADILPGFYMDKRNWISLKIDGDLSDELIMQLCDTAYDLIFAKLTKKLQREILGQE